MLFSFPTLNSRYVLDYMLEDEGLMNIRVFDRTFDQQCFKHFMCIVYKPFHDKSLKNISSITFISVASL